MKYIGLGANRASNIVMGCMRIAGKTEKEVSRLVHTALDGGINLFDHADIYGKGESERIFGEVLKNEPGLRDRMLIQSKCGIRPGMYDFSYPHILSAVNGSLSRLGVEHLDVLIFHRPDALAEKEDFALAVEALKKSGKVKSFGVSNMNPAQIELLESWTGEKMVADQLQLSVMHAGMLSSGMNVNVDSTFGTEREGMVLPYLTRRGIALQAWSPFQYGMFEGCFLNNDKFPELKKKLDELASRYSVTESAVALAWILKIPGAVQAVLGTTNVEHMEEALLAQTFTLTRKEWYELYLAAGYPLP